MNFSFVLMKSFPEVTQQDSIKLLQTFTTIRVSEYWILIHKNYKQNNTRRSIAVLLRWFTTFPHFLTHIWSEADQTDGSVGGCSPSLNLSKALLNIMYYFCVTSCLNNLVNWIPHIFEISRFAPVNGNFSHLH